MRAPKCCTQGKCQVSVDRYGIFLRIDHVRESKSFEVVKKALTVLHVENIFGEERNISASL